MIHDCRAIGCVWISFPKQLLLYDVLSGHLLISGLSFAFGCPCWQAFVRSLQAWGGSGCSCPAKVFRRTTRTEKNRRIIYHAAPQLTRRPECFLAASGCLLVSSVRLWVSPWRFLGASKLGVQMHYGCFSEVRQCCLDVS